MAFSRWVIYRTQGRRHQAVPSFIPSLACSCVAATLLCAAPQSIGVGSHHRTSEAAGGVAESDLAAPETAIDAGPSGLTNERAPTFTFSSSEPGSTFQCSIDGGDFGVCDSLQPLAPLADGPHTFAVEAIGPFSPGFLSPALSNSHQGYATDGTYHYTIGTNEIQKANSDWSIVAENSSPNADLAADHLGGAAYYDGKLYIPSSRFVSCSNNSDQNILVFNSTTLARLSANDISPKPADLTRNAGALAIAPDIGANGTIFVIHYCGWRYVHKYDLSTFDYLGGLYLSKGISSAQGLAYRDGRLYVSSDYGLGKIYVVDATTGTTALAYTSDDAALNWEGIDYSQDTLRWLLDFGGGSQQVRYLSAGATDTTPATRSFTIDTVAPETTISAGPSGLTNERAPTFAFSASEAGSTFQCSIDRGDFTVCSSPTTLEPLTDGAHTFAVEGVDPAGNVDRTPAVRTLAVDTVAPDTALTKGPVGVTNNPNPTFEFSASKVGSTFRCSIDGGDFTICSSPAKFGPLADGTHFFTVEAIDPAGNVGPAISVRPFSIDTALGRISARLTRKAFPRVDATRVRVVYRFSPRSKSFGYVLARRKGGKWLTVRRAVHAGHFWGTNSVKIRALFSSKPVRSGRYRLVLFADKNRSVLRFRIAED